MATILTKKSDTASAVPLAADLTNAAGGAELAVNATDKRLFSKTSGGSVVELGTNPSSLTMPNGTANGVPYLNGSKVVTSGSALTFDGTSFVVGGSTFPDGRIRLKQASDASKQKGLLIEAYADDSLLAIGYDGSAFTFNPTYNTTGAYKPMAWWVSGSEQMRLTSTGLGIGTSSPQALFQVRNASNAPIVASSNLTNGAFSQIVLSHGSTYFGASDRAYQLLSQTDGSSARFGIQYYNGSTYSENLTLDASGNLGLGVTPSAYGSGAKALEVNASSTYWGYASGGVYITGMSNNTYGAGATNRYKNTATAGEYSITGNVHAWYTAPSGTAGNAITFTQAMTLDASGNLGVGTTSPSARFTAQKASGAGTVGSFSDGTAGVDLAATATGGSVQAFNTNQTIDFKTFGTGTLNFFTNNTERARIDSSGNFLLGATAVTASAKFLIQGSSATYNFIVIKDTATSFPDNNYALFQNDSGANAGKIAHTGSTTVSYVTSSDYRLKENVQPMVGALDKVAQLKPCTYTWKADGTFGQGFIAHELQAIVPEAVVGKKDALNEDGSINAQGVDTSFLVATLTAAIQELKAEFDAYKASHP